MTPPRTLILAKHIVPVALPARALSTVSLATGDPDVVPLIACAEPWATVEVWKVVPGQIDDPVENLLAILDPGERERARRQTGRSLRTFVIAHACLREVLAAKIGLDPRRVEFSRSNSNGKPALADDTHRLTFNVSHTRGLILIALARWREIGVDAECLGRHVREDALSRRRFTEPELSELARAPEDRRVRGFLQLWTRREAHAKMTGEGLRRATADGMGPSGPFGGAASLVCDLDLGRDHVGALAVQLDT